MVITTEGKTAIWFWSVNSASVSATDSQVAYALIDRTAPIVTTNAAELTASGQSAATLMLAAKDKLSGVAVGGFSARLDGQASVVATAVGTVRFKNMALGAHVVEYSATDLAGNVATGQAEFVLRDVPTIASASASLSAKRRAGVATYKLSAIIHSGEATPLVGASLVLEQKSTSGAWKRYGRAVSSDAFGKVTMTVSVKKTGKMLCRWRAIATATERQAVSATITLKTR